MNEPRDKKDPPLRDDDLLSYNSSLPPLVWFVLLLLPIVLLGVSTLKNTLRKPPEPAQVQQEQTQVEPLTQRKALQINEAPDSTYSASTRRRSRIKN